MKIIYYSPHPELNLTDLAGYGTHMREMIKAFQRLGHEVLPVIMGGTEPRTCKPSGGSSARKVLKQFAPGIVKRTIKDSLLLQSDKKAGELLEQKIAAFKPDLIYERANYLNVSGVKAAKKNNLKHILEVNSPYVDETKEFSKSATGFIKTALKREKEQLLGTDLALFVSSSLQHYFIKKIAGLDIKKTLVTPNCINPENIHTSQLVENKIKDKYQLEGATVIGFVGSIFPYHGVDILIDAFDKLFKNYPETKLLIVGDGQSLGMLKEHAKSLHSNEHIIFTGNVKYAEVFSYINTMDITVLANTNWYCSPIKLLEYGAMGKATIAPDTDAVKDIMINEVNGLLAKPTVISVEKALHTYMEKPELREKFAQSFKNKILGHYTWTMCAKRILEFPKSSE